MADQANEENSGIPVALNNMLNANRIRPIDLISASAFYIPSPFYDPMNHVAQTAKRHWEHGLITANDTIIRNEEWSINSSSNSC